MNKDVLLDLKWQIHRKDREHMRLNFALKNECQFHVKSLIRV